MNYQPMRITLDSWDNHYKQLRRDGLDEASYGGPISRHLKNGDRGLTKLRFDNSAAALRLWNFLLTEEQRLHQARAAGKKIVGTMKDLGTVPVLVYSFENITAFYPDGAWWLPCIMGHDTDSLMIADSLGIDESFCPVRAMLGAFINKAHFPIPDQLICSVGATCDDFSAIAQRLNGLGFPILWWEIPHRRSPEKSEIAIKLPGGFLAVKQQVEFVKSELHRIKESLEDLTGQYSDENKLSAGIKKANLVRHYLAELRQLVFTAERCPMPALEMLVAEMLAIHFCSDREESIIVLKGLVEEVKKRVHAKKGVHDLEAARIFWVNPVADIQIMNLLEDCGGRICGTEYLFSHALDIIPDNLPPEEALAQMAIADPMAGSAIDRAERICKDIRSYGSEAVLISRIPGASHCALEGQIIGEIVRTKFDIPVLEIEVPAVADSVCQMLRTRLEALVETVINRRKK